MTTLREAWSALASGLKILELVEFSANHWSLLERLHANFNDREAHAHLPIPIARFAEDATQVIHEHVQRFDDVRTEYVDDSWMRENFAAGAPDPMAVHARRYNEDVDRLMGVLVPSARYRKGHYAYGKFTVASPHGLHTDHTAEDPAAKGEPICIARLRTLGTHYVAGDYRTQDAETRSMLEALRYWVPVPQGEPDSVLDELLRRRTLKTIPVDHVMLMVAGNGSSDCQVTQHIAARPPEAGQHSAFFQRQYKLT